MSGAWAVWSVWLSLKKRKWKKKREEEKENRTKQRERRKEKQGRTEISKREGKREESSWSLAKLNIQRDLHICSSSAASSSSANKDLPTRSQPKGALQDSTNALTAKRSWANTKNVDSNRCSIYLQSCDEDVELGFGVELIQCTCLRWLHRDCIIYCITDSSGKERLCPFCSWM